MFLWQFRVGFEDLRLLFLFGLWLRLRCDLEYGLLLDLFCEVLLDSFLIDLLKLLSIFAVKDDGILFV
jgi:hypothetical protein